METKVGCGKSIPTGLMGWDCSRPCGSDPKQLCGECIKKRDSKRVGEMLRMFRKKNQVIMFGIFSISICIYTYI